MSFNYFSKLKNSRGEIATTLTIATLAVLVAGIFVGTQLSQENTDVRSRAQSSCPLGGNPQLIAGGKCQISTGPSTTLVCALIDPSLTSDQIIAGQVTSQINWIISSGTGTVPLKNPSKPIVSGTTYRLVVYQLDKATWQTVTPSGCERATDISGSDVAQAFGSSTVNPTNTPVPNQPTNTPVPDQPTVTPTPINCPSASFCSANCTDPNLVCVPRGNCTDCAQKTPTPTPSSCQIEKFCTDNCSLSTSTCVQRGSCWDCAKNTPTPAPSITPTVTPIPTSSVAKCSASQGICRARSQCSSDKVEGTDCETPGLDIICCLENINPTPTSQASQGRWQNASFTSSCGIKVEPLNENYIKASLNGREYVLPQRKSNKLQETINYNCPGTKLDI